MQRVQSKSNAKFDIWLQNKTTQNNIPCIRLFLNRNIKISMMSKVFHFSKYSNNFHQLSKELYIKVITKLPNSEQSYKGKVKTHNYINRQNQSTTGKLWKNYYTNPWVKWNKAACLFSIYLIKDVLDLTIYIFLHNSHFSTLSNSLPFKISASEIVYAFVSYHFTYYEFTSKYVRTLRDIYTKDV